MAGAAFPTFARAPDSGTGLSLAFLSGMAGAPLQHMQAGPRCRCNESLRYPMGESGCTFGLIGAIAFALRLHRRKLVTTAGTPKIIPSIVDPNAEDAPTGFP